MLHEPRERERAVVNGERDIRRGGLKLLQQQILFFISFILAPSRAPLVYKLINNQYQCSRERGGERGEGRGKEEIP